ncbi:MAG: carbohydrate kinase family protein [Planctomycetota bacterium]|jgi:fructokinase
MSDQKTYTLVGLGEILWDLLPEGKQLGGAPANFAYHAQALGGKGVVVSCIGDDDLGKEITGILTNLGLEQRHIAVDTDHPTGTVTVELDDKGVPNFTIHTDVAWDFIPSNPDLLELASKADAVCFGSLCQRSDVSRQTVGDFLQATRPDCLRVFDINIRQHYYSKDIVQNMLEISNVLKLNDDELPIVAELLDITGSETEVLASLVDKFNLKLVVLTKGDKGSRLYSKDEDSENPGIAVEKIADTVGAGDAFTAAVAFGVLLGKGLDDINEHANKVAAFVCSQNGATPKLPDSLVF